MLSPRVCFQISPDPPSTSDPPISLRIRKAARKCKVMRWTCWTPTVLGGSLGQHGLIQGGSEANRCYGDGGPRPGSRRCIDKTWPLFHKRKFTCNVCVDLAFAGVGRSCECLPHPAHGVRLRDLAPQLIATVRRSLILCRRQHDHSSGPRDNTGGHVGQPRVVS